MKKLLTLLLALTCFSTFAKQIKLNNKNSISFNRSFTNEFVSKKMVEATNKCLVQNQKDIYIVLYTPGGSVSAGQKFIEYLNALPCNFHTITSFAASMGYITAQLLEGKRYILSSGVLMSHRASIRGLGGEINGELDSILSLIKHNIYEIDKKVVKRIGIELENYRNLIADELWLTSNMSVTMNHADEEISAICDSSLSGTETQTIRTFFGTFKVTFSKCPLITGVLGVTRANGYSANTKEIQSITNMFENLSQHIKTEL